MTYREPLTNAARKGRKREGGPRRRLARASRGYADDDSYQRENEAADRLHDPPLFPL